MTYTLMDDLTGLVPEKSEPKLTSTVSVVLRHSVETRSRSTNVLSVDPVD